MLVRAPAYSDIGNLDSMACFPGGFGICDHTLTSVKFVPGSTAVCMVTAASCKVLQGTAPEIVSMLMLLQGDAQQLRQENNELQHQVASLQLSSPRPRSPLRQMPSLPGQQSSVFFKLPQVCSPVPDALAKH